MATIAMALPILSGKSDGVREFMSEVAGPKLAEFETSEARIGIVREGWFLQPTPMGDLAVVHAEGDDPVASLGAFIASDDPFDVWFKQQILELTGVDLTQAGPPIETLLDWNAPARV
jgi:hypothetical protein